MTFADTQTQTLMRILSDNKHTDYGRRYGFSTIKTVGAYQNVLPVTNYDDYAPMIELATRLGEKNIITRDVPACYTLTSGTMGVPKKIPCSASHLKRFVELVKELPEKDNIFALFESRPKDKPFADGTYIDTVSGALTDGLRKHTRDYSASRNITRRYAFTSPAELLYPEAVFDQRHARLLFALMDRKVSQITAPFTWALLDIFIYLEHNWRTLTADMANGTIDPLIAMPKATREKLEKKIKKDPKRAAELNAVFESGFEEPVVKRIWPNISYIMAAGTGGFEIYTRKLKRYIGDIPVDNGYYASSEALIARADKDGGYVLLADSAFYEFAPVSGGNPVTGDRLEDGGEYELLITNNSGLYRYRVGDVVRAAGFVNGVPRITYAYRLNQCSSIAGERVTEEDLAYAVRGIEAETGLNIADYCLWPDAGGYTVVLERADISGGGALIEQVRVSEAAERRMAQACKSYSEARASGRLEAARVLFVQPQTFLLYRDLKCFREKTSEAQIKPIRLLDNPDKEKFFFALIDRDVHSDDDFEYYFGQFRRE